METLKKIIIFIITYSIAAFAAVILYQNLLFTSILLKLFLCDLFAATILFIESLFCKKMFLYDPFIGLSIFIIAVIFYNRYQNYTIYGLITIILLCIWSFLFFIFGFCNMMNNKHQGTIYRIKEKYNKVLSFILLCLVYLVPTFISYLAVMPALHFTSVIATSTTYAPTAMTLVAYIVLILGIILENLAVIQNKNNLKKQMHAGLWKNSRHPDYFGQIIFFFAVFLLEFSMEGGNLIFISSPLVVFLLYEFLIIPLEEKNLIKKDSKYIKYKETTNPLSILPTSKKNNSK